MRSSLGLHRARRLARGFAGWSVKFGLPPIARPDARMFILGSLPGDASLAARRYYAHPTNQFWKLLGGAIGEELQSLAYEARLERLAERRIGLWDVIASASGRGSLDQAIRCAGHNPIERLLDDFPEVAAIAFNGGTAARLGPQIAWRAVTGVTLIDLPSSSAANTRPFAEKAAAWAGLGEYRRTLELAPRAESATMAMMIPTDEDEADSDKRLSMVDEALVAGTIANTNGLLVILAKLVAKGVFDRDDLKAFSDSYSKPLDHGGMRENELVTQMQDQMESTLAELMRFLSEREKDG